MWTINKQATTKRAKVILAIVYRDCYATPEERESILRGLAEDRQRIEEEKRQMYNPDDIFAGSENHVTQIEENLVEDPNIEQSVTLPNDGFFTRLIRKIKSFFSKNWLIYICLI